MSSKPPTSDSPLMVRLVFTPGGERIIGYNVQSHIQIWRAPLQAQIEAAEKGQTP